MRKRPPSVARTGAAPRRVQRRLWPWLPVAVLFLVPVFWLQRHMPSLWPILNVEVRGEFQHLRVARLRGLVEQHLRGNMLAANLEEVSAALLSEAWVETVTVRRLWPNRLQVELREQRPVVRWGEEGFLNARGELFPARGNAETARLPLLRGPPDATRVVLSHYLALRKGFAATGLYLENLELSTRGAWVAGLRGGARIYLGQTEQLARRVRRLLRYAVTLSAERKALLRRVDLRYDGGLAALHAAPEHSLDMRSVGGIAGEDAVGEIP